MQSTIHRYNAGSRQSASSSTSGTQCRQTHLGQVRPLQSQRQRIGVQARGWRDELTADVELGQSTSYSGQYDYDDNVYANSAEEGLYPSDGACNFLPRAFVIQMANKCTCRASSNSIAEAVLNRFPRQPLLVYMLTICRARTGGRAEACISLKLACILQ